MGYGYLLMGITMSLLTVMLSIKVTVLHHYTRPRPPPPRPPPPPLCPEEGK